MVVAGCDRHEPLVFGWNITLPEVIFKDADVAASPRHDRAVDLKTQAVALAGGYCYEVRVRRRNIGLTRLVVPPRRYRTDGLEAQAVRPASGNRDESFGKVHPNDSAAPSDDRAGILRPGRARQGQGEDHRSNHETLC